MEEKDEMKMGEVKPAPKTDGGKKTSVDQKNKAEVKMNKAEGKMDEVKPSPSAIGNEQKLCPPAKKPPVPPPIMMPTAKVKQDS